MSDLELVAQTTELELVVDPGGVATALVSRHAGDPTTHPELPRMAQVHAAAAAAARAVGASAVTADQVLFIAQAAASAAVAAHARMPSPHAAALPDQAQNILASQFFGV